MTFEKVPSCTGHDMNISKLASEQELKIKASSLED